MLHFLLASSILLTSVIALQARELVISGVGASRDVHCDGHEVAIQGVGHNITVTGVCNSIDIRGTKHTVSFEEADDIDIDGAETRVRGKEANSVDIGGRGHRVELAIDGEDESGELDVAGVGNHVRATLLSGADIEISGHSNVVEWTLADGATKPSVNISGIDNVAKQISR